MDELNESNTNTSINQDFINYLIKAKKAINERIIIFPGSNEVLHLPVILIENPIYHLLCDIDRKGRINTLRCTFQTRYQETVNLVRLDLNGRPHDNPSTTPINPIFLPYVGKHLPCPHLHLYQHGFGDKWAIPMPEDLFINPTNLVQTFKDFCRYCTISEVPHISYQEQLNHEHL
jgi:hypothetical protein